MFHKVIKKKKPHAQKKIMVIDNDLEFLEEVRRIFEQGPYEIICIQDSRLALEIMDQKRPDLILLDPRIPYKNGFQLVKDIRSRFDSIPLIIVSGISTEAGRYIAVKNEALEFLEKPVDFEKLKYHMEDILDMALPVLVGKSQ